MNQRFNHILNNLESRVDLFNLKKELLSKSLNHVIKQEAKKESEIKKQKAARGERKSEKPEKPAEGGEQPAARRRRKSEQE